MKRRSNSKRLQDAISQKTVMLMERKSLGEPDVIISMGPEF
jgi:hypothetical protein